MMYLFPLVLYQLRNLPGGPCYCHHLAVSGARRGVGGQAAIYRPHEHLQQLHRGSVVAHPAIYSPIRPSVCSSVRLLVCSSIRRNVSLAM